MVPLENVKPRVLYHYSVNTVIMYLRIFMCIFFPEAVQPQPTQTALRHLANSRSRIWRLVLKTLRRNSSNTHLYNQPQQQIPLEAPVN